MNHLVVLLNITLGAISLLLLFPASVFSLEIVFGLLSRCGSAQPLGERRPLAVLVPAHDEALVIQRTLRTIAPQLDAADRLVVIADNCSDDTANLALLEGAEVIVRTDRDRRGKGYALDFGVRHLEKSAPEIVIFVDADCWVESEAIDRIARLCAQTRRPVQALYLMRAPQWAGLRMRIAEFAWLVKNQVRPGGLRKLGLPCQLTGTGMAFTWTTISTANLATGHIVEDMKLGVDLARSGSAPLFCPDALVTSEFPHFRIGRSRPANPLGAWPFERHRERSPPLVPGFPETTGREVHGHGLRPQRSSARAADAPGGRAVERQPRVSSYWTREPFSFVVTSLAATLIVCSTLVAWSRFGRHIISLRELGFALVYPIAKIPVYVKFLWGRQMEWVRSKRDGENS